MLKLFEIIKGRRSVRSFERERPVDEGTITLILDAARWAPSAGNGQPWKFYVIADEKRKKDFVAAALRQKFIMDAAVVIVVCIDTAMASSQYGERGSSLYAIQDTAAAVQNMLLMTHYIGLAGCWVGAFNEKDVSRTLDILPHIRPVAIIPIGHPLSPPQEKDRKPLTDVVTWLK